MGPRRIRIDAPPERVWEVLSDPHAYDDWVVGTREIRSADASWPQVGARLHHPSGLPLLSVRDATEVLESETAKRLVLRAKLRPLGTLRVEIELRGDGPGTEVTIQEFVESGPLRLTGPVGDAGAQARLELGLRRLKRLSETRIAV